MSVSVEFGQVTDPFRRELVVHCYRLLGSVHDAEDLVQETMLRAWRAYDRFDERKASLRTWLYRIATNACLTALETRRRRPLPSGLATSSDELDWPSVTPRADLPWLQPIPDSLLDEQSGDPAAIVAARGSVRLAFVAAMQYLPPRQRAVLILREVLAWPATEVADLLGTTTTAVHSALQRARAQLAQVTPAEDQVSESADHRALLDRYVEAFQNADITSLTRLLREDAELEMPPYTEWFSGRAAVTRCLTTLFAHRERGEWRAVHTRANGQVALGTYLRHADGVHRSHGVHALSLVDNRISRITAFHDPALHPVFGLPSVLDVTAPRSLAVPG
jgi:RNA polymerase sigma-70 factor (ECF subfamily)